MSELYPREHDCRHLDAPVGHHPGLCAMPRCFIENRCTIGWWPEVVDVRTLLPFARLAATEGVSVKLDRGTTWWAVLTAMGRPIGFAGLWQGATVSRFKGAWTDPGERGRGIGSALVATILEAAPTDRPLEVIHRAGGDEAFWPARGLPFTGKVRPNGGRVYRRPVP